MTLREQFEEETGRKFPELLTDFSWSSYNTEEQYWQKFAMWLQSHILQKEDGSMNDGRKKEEKKK
jgi:hypothetical protein